MKRRLGLLGIFILVAMACADAGSRQAQGSAPDFKLQDLQGHILSLGDFRGKVVLLNFWATWCPPCRAEIPDFIEAYNQYKDKGMVIIGLSVDQMSAEDLLSFVAGHKMSYPIAFATQDVIGDYKPGNYIPSTIFIDKQGQIRHKKVGAISKEELLKVFDQLVNEK
jgi:cytochrome c biogenesis protein CcmG/thiol:disulfide interchange protein DsbE